MKKMTKLTTVALAIVGLLGASDAVAQRARGSGRTFDPKTVETIQGKVLSVEKPTSPTNRGYGIHLTLQLDKETIAVHLGPAWYVEKQTPHIEANDTVIVTGSRVTLDGQPTIIAAQVKKGTEVLKLRDDNGVPAWSGAGRRDQ